MSHRLVFITYYYPPSTQMAAQRAGQLVRFLTGHGWSVQVITTGDADTTEGPVCRVRDPWARVTTTAQTTGPTSGGWRGALVRLGRAVIPFDSSLRWNLRAARVVPADTSAVLLTSAPPFATTLAGWLVKRRCPAVRWVHELRDLVATNPIYSWGRVRRWTNFRLERRLLRRANGLVALTDEILNTYRHDYALQNPARVTYNGYDAAFVAAVRERPTRPAPELRLLHVGSFYGARSPHVLLRGLRAALDQAPDLAGRIRVTLVGQLGQTAAEAESALALIRELRLADHVRVLPPVPHDQLVEFYRDADGLLLVTHADGTSRYAVPGKLFEYIGVGKPIFAITNDPLPAKLIATHKLGWTCPHDPAAVAARLIDIAAHPAPVIPPATAGQFAIDEQFAQLESFLAAPHPAP